MNEPKPKETQQELFEQFSDAPKQPERFPQIARTHKPMLVSTNTEQLLMAGILLILVLCGVFFLGVMRGKALSGAIPAERPAEDPFSPPASRTAVRPPAPPAEPAPTAMPAPPAPSKP
jgi:hypothetical protein